MDFNFNDLITDIQIHPKYQNLISIGVGKTIRYIRYDTRRNFLYETRCINIPGYARGFQFTPTGDSLISILNEGETRVFNEELNLKRLYKLDEEVNAIGQPFVDENGTNIGIDVLIGTDSGKILGYDTRSNSSKPSITIENHSNTVNMIKCNDWWGCTSIADDGFLVLNDFRNKRTPKSEFGPLKGIPRDLCICPYSKKTVVCNYEHVYVFKSDEFDNGPLLKTGPAYTDKMPSACLSLSTHERPDLFGISYVDSSFITILDADEHIWLRRYATKHIGSDLFAYPIRKTHGYVYFAGDDTYFCIRNIDDIREDCDQILFLEAGDKSINLSKNYKKDGISNIDDNEDETDDDDELYDYKNEIYKPKNKDDIIDEDDNGSILDMFDDMIDDEYEDIDMDDDEPKISILNYGKKRKASDRFYKALALKRKIGKHNDDDIEDDEDFVIEDVENDGNTSLALQQNIYDVDEEEDEEEDDDYDEEDEESNDDDEENVKLKQKRKASEKFYKALTKKKIVNIDDEAESSEDEDFVLEEADEENENTSLAEKLAQSTWNNDEDDESEEEEDDDYEEIEDDDIEEHFPVIPIVNYGSKRKASEKFYQVLAKKKKIHTDTKDDDDEDDSEDDDFELNENGFDDSKK